MDDEDFALLSQWKWQAWQSHSGNWYATRTDTSGERPKGVRMHRFLLSAPIGVLVDHRNGESLDNRRSNLRLVTNAQNCQNRRHRASSIKRLSKFKGVTRKHGSERVKVWQARIYAENVMHHLGFFASEEEAARAYDAAAVRLHGEFACLNFDRSVPPKAW